MPLPALYSMASQKVRPTALWRFFRTSTYLMYAFAPEKPPSLAGRNFCLAILWFFAKASKDDRSARFFPYYLWIIGPAQQLPTQLRKTFLPPAGSGSGKE
jgi:hypothetical protein